jgi:hypothetical protein
MAKADASSNPGSYLYVAPWVIDNTSSKRELLLQHQSNLSKLKLQAAKYGSVDVPLHIQNQIEDEENKIAEIEADLNHPTSDQTG